MNDIPISAQNLSTPYKPVALYYEASDILQYVRKDGPSVHRRIDSLLTLIFDMKNRDELIGFALKGLKSACLKDEVAQRNEFPRIGARARQERQISKPVTTCEREEDGQMKLDQIPLVDAPEDHEFGCEHEFTREDLMRKAALELAIQNMRALPADEVVTTAQAFFAFLSAEGSL